MKQTMILLATFLLPQALRADSPMTYHSEWGMSQGLPGTFKADVKYVPSSAIGKLNYTFVKGYEGDGYTIYDHCEILGDILMGEFQLALTDPNATVYPLEIRKLVLQVSVEKPTCDPVDLLEASDISWYGLDLNPFEYSELKLSVDLFPMSRSSLRTLVSNLRLVPVADNSVAVQGFDLEKFRKATAAEGGDQIFRAELEATYHGEPITVGNGTYNGLSFGYAELVPVN